MMSDSYRDTIVQFFNDARVEAGLAEVVVASSEFSMNSVATQNISIPGFKVETESDISVKMQELMDQNVKLQNYTLSKEFTHIGAKTVPTSSSSTETETEGDEGGAGSDLVISFYSRYLEIEAPGHLIDGDLVVQGTTTSADLGPCLCIIDFISDDSDEVKEKVAVIKPWDMMTEPSAEEASLLNFIIPVKLPDQFKGLPGSAKVRVFVDQVSKISYSEESADFDDSSDKYVCAIEFIAKQADSAVEGVDVNGVLALDGAAAVAEGGGGHQHHPAMGLHVQTGSAEGGEEDEGSAVVGGVVGGGGTSTGGKDNSDKAGAADA
jgi:hypothetical protein